ncbi:ion channel activity protein [Cadophora gregata]|uniref:ion channel activity protein n=1 Tax=Cadophora gregata TaxID=51156 RepID=UPI0026DCA198|nr:ion channel activity protein [Cadophora gregata]KAK0111342.1 ion channel activity protein [Cadophora gregata]
MSAFDHLAGRDALTANPNIFNYPRMSDINITSRGSDLYWAVSAIMGVSALAFIAHAHIWVAPKHSHRLEYVIFHYITAAICFVACIAYFTMASNLGYAAIMVEFQRSDPVVAGLYREIFYVRYIDWVITTPLLLLDVLLTAGLPWSTILITILVDEIMIVTGLVGALVSSQYKWGYFVFAMISLFFIAYNVVYVGPKHAGGIRSSNQTDIKKSYILAAGWTMGLWFLYPIAWGISEGGNVISPDSEAIFYSVLDVLAKPGFGLVLLWAHRNIKPEDIGIHVRSYDQPRMTHYLSGANRANGAYDREKLGHTGGLDGANVPAHGSGSGAHPTNGTNGIHSDSQNGHSGGNPVNSPQDATGMGRQGAGVEAFSSSANPAVTSTGRA